VGWVDDETGVRSMASRLVERSGGLVHAFLDHAALLDAAQEIAFDVVVLQPTDDIPVMEVLAFFRGAPRSARIMLASGSDSDVLEGRGINVAAFDAFLRKPFPFQEVIDAVSPERRGPGAPNEQ
jgi:DNA-binding response OmpR family regulator